MANLLDQDRFDVWADWMRSNTETISISKTDLRAAVNAIDNFLESNATTINNAFPVAARNGLTTSQKASVLMAVTAKRWLKGA